MKTYIPAILVLLILALLVGAGFVTAGLFASPEAGFSQRVDEKVEQAQRMLAQYEGGQPLLQATLERLTAAKAQPATQPADASAAGQPRSDARRDYLTQRKEHLDQHRDELSRELTARGSSTEEHPAEFDSDAELQKRVQENADLLAKALDTVRGAVKDSEGELSGSSNPVATRLEAMLIYHQADLQRRTAAVHEARAEANRNAFAAVLASWREADNRVKTLQAELAGTAGGTIGAPGPAPAAAQAPAPAGKPAARPAAPKAGAGPSGGGLLGKLGNLLGKKPKAQPPEAPITPAPAKSDNTTDNTAAAPQPPAEAPAPAAPVAIGAVPPIDDRIKELQGQAEQTDAQIAEAQKEVDRLSTAVAGLQASRDKARSQAEAAEKRKMELEDAGIDPADPDAMKRFKEQYLQAARINRDATREAEAFENGVLRNARPDAREENEILTAPLVPMKPDQKITSEPGLVALQADLKAATALVETRQALRKQIDAQIKGLETRRDQLKAALEKAQTWRAALAKEATERARAAIVQAIQAEELENKAASLLAGEGKTAVDQARSAASKRGTEVQEFHRKQAAGSPQTGFLAGHVDAIAGDLELERALVLAQQSDGLRRHEPMLAALVQMGIDPATLPSAKTAAEPAADQATAVPPGTPTTQPQAIAQKADEKRTQALEAGTAALEHYKKASDALNRLWTVHTQMAAVHYLMASLETGDKAQKDRDDALHEYQLATRDRPDRPETKAYRPMMEALAPQK